MSSNSSDMVKKILSTFVFTFLFIISSYAFSEVNVGDTYASVSEFNSNENISITLVGNKLKVQNAAGETLDIYSITGAKVATYKIEHNEQVISIDLGKGCYIVKVKSIARKISISK